MTRQPGNAPRRAHHCAAPATKEGAVARIALSARSQQVRELVELVELLGTHRPPRVGVVAKVCGEGAGRLPQSDSFTRQGAAIGEEVGERCPDARPVVRWQVGQVLDQG